jgi:acyl carrier protein
MKREDVAEKIIFILVDTLGVDVEEANNETADLQNDLGADSLDAVELIMRLEQEFGIGIPDDQAEEIKTVKDIIDYVYKHMDEY